MRAICWSLARSRRILQLASSACWASSMAAPYAAGRTAFQSQEIPMPPAPTQTPTAADGLLSPLDLEPLEQNLFRGRSPKQGWQRVYGGQVLGQALVAAVRTVEPDRICHSMHAYFLLGG